MAAVGGSITFEEDLAADGGDNNDVDDIFGGPDDPFNIPAPLPPLSPTRDNFGLNDVDGGASKSAEKKKVAKKRSPQPRLNETRLCSERGISALAHLCKDIKFKGKGHETSDVKILLQKFEHWAHRLYPKFPFEDVVEKVEALGGKKLVQNAIKRVRRGDDDDDVQDKDSSDDELHGNGVQEATFPSMTNINFGIQVQAGNAPSFGIQVQAGNTPLGLTPEQLERIRLNRERAMDRRKDLQTPVPDTSIGQTDTLGQDDSMATSTTLDNHLPCGQETDEARNRKHDGNDEDDRISVSEVEDSPVVQSSELDRPFGDMVTAVNQSSASSANEVEMTKDSELEKPEELSTVPSSSSNTKELVITQSRNENSSGEEEEIVKKSSVSEYEGSQENLSSEILSKSEERKGDLTSESLENICGSIDGTTWENIDNTEYVHVPKVNAETSENEAQNGNTEESVPMFYDASTTHNTKMMDDATDLADDGDDEAMVEGADSMLSKLTGQNKEKATCTDEEPMETTEVNAM